MVSCVGNQGYQGYDMLSGYGFYRIYQSLHLHFTSTYDVFKYGGKSKTINTNLYNKRRDKTIFERLAPKFQSEKRAGQFVLANFVYNSNDWLYQPYQQADEIYIKWKSIRDSLLTHIKNDLNVLSQVVKEQETCNIFDKTPKGNKPPLLQLFLARRISKECLVCLDDVYSFTDNWSDWYEIDPLISDQLFVLKKYKPFVSTTQTNELIKEFKIK